MNVISYILIFFVSLPPRLGEIGTTPYPGKFSATRSAQITLYSNGTTTQHNAINFLAAAKNDALDCKVRIDALTSYLVSKAISDQEKLQVQLDKAYYRYKKGIEVLKMLYEKILALDHHFSTLRTFADIQELSNPNSYPEFANAKLSFKHNTEKKSTVDLPDFLDNNPFISVGYTLISSVFGEGNKKEREAEIDNISCVLDFTISMHSDIKIIYYETDFLRMSNKELLGKCRVLFEDYIAVINYPKTLDYCRNNDDWDNLYLSLDQKIEILGTKLNNGTDKKMNVQLKNLEFSVDRLIKFIEQYEDFIYQGEQYYLKFKTIINSYQNKGECVDRLPNAFRQLENEINFSIDKFKTAYNLAELQGSKLRDLIYGNPEDI